MGLIAMIKIKPFLFVPWLIMLLMLGVVNGVSASAPDDTATPQLSQADAIQQAQKFYDTRGEWAGKFTITNVWQIRFESQGAAKVIAHIRYQAAFLQDMSKTVEDQRTFGFSYEAGVWQVKWMGGHKSARF